MSLVQDPTPSAALPPPVTESGPVGWVRANLFSTWYNGILTVVFATIAALALWFGLRWVLGEADWRVIATLGPRLVIGQYNIEASCPGQGCFWRPQVVLLLVNVLLGMAWGVAQGGVTRRVALTVAVASALFAFLPYSFERMGWDVRLLLLANLPAVLAGVGVSPDTPGSARLTGLQPGGWLPLC